MSEVSCSTARLGLALGIFASLSSRPLVYSYPTSACNKTAQVSAHIVITATKTYLTLPLCRNWEASYKCHFLSSQQSVRLAWLTYLSTWNCIIIQQTNKSSNRLTMSIFVCLSIHFVCVCFRVLSHCLGPRRDRTWLVIAKRYKVSF